MNRKQQTLIVIATCVLPTAILVAMFMWPRDDQGRIRQHLASMQTAAAGGDEQAFIRHRDALVSLGHLHKKHFVVPQHEGFTEALIAEAKSLPVVTWRPQGSDQWAVVVTADAVEMERWDAFMEAWQFRE